MRSTAASILLFICWISCEIAARSAQNRCFSANSFLVMPWLPVFSSSLSASNTSPEITSPIEVTSSAVRADTVGGESAMAADSQSIMSSRAPSTAASLFFPDARRRKRSLTALRHDCSDEARFAALEGAISGSARSKAPGQPCRVPAQPPQWQVRPPALSQLPV